MSSQLIRFKPYTLLLYNSFWKQEYTFADNFLALAALVKWPLACQVPEDGNSRSIDMKNIYNPPNRIFGISSQIQRISP
jgi:hypothetical protein